MMKGLNLPNLTDSTSRWIVVAVLVVMTAAVFAPVRHHQFLNFDDNLYVTENSRVNSGLSRSNVRWAFTSIYAGNWHPLTWMSHMLDIQLFGFDPGWHHIINVILHAINAVLLFMVLQAMTGALFPSAAAAALFAVHPLHVESVAWIAERKDLLSAFFAFLTIGAYRWYSNRPSVGRYLSVVVFFALGLMAKPMVMTLPFILLLLDFWPLGRLVVFESGDRGPGKNFWKTNRPVLLEKIPLFAMTVLSAVITYLAQREGAAVSTAYPLGVRITNAFASYLDYVVKTFYPVRLAIFYPHPGYGVSIFKAVLGGGLIVAVTAAVLLVVKRLPYLAVGWFWFLGSLVPVIGLVQVGSQAMADRYTYIPLIGIFIAVIWLISEASTKWKRQKSFLFVATAAVILFFSATAGKQVSHWRDNVTLYNHALKVTADNYVAFYNLGLIYTDLDHLEKAMELFIKAIKANPNFSKAHYNLGLAYWKLGVIQKATEHYQKALLLDPDYIDSLYNLGVIQFEEGKIQEAISLWLRAESLSPDSQDILFNLGTAYSRLGQTEKAEQYFRRARNRAPDPD